MIPRLFAARYDDHSYTSTNPVEVFHDVENLGIRWSLLKFGVQRFELTIAAHSEFDAYDRFQNHQGQLIAIFDSYIDKCITGNVFEVSVNGRSVTYICAGNTTRLYDELFNLSHMSDLTPTSHTDVAIIDVLDDATSVISSDQTNIDATSLDMGAWKPRGYDQEGMFAGDAIKELAEMGDGSNNIWDFYLVDQPLNGVKIKMPLPYFKQRSSTAAINWQFNKRDIAAGGLTLGRHLWDWQSHIKVGYGRISGTHDGGASAHLIDLGVNFETLGVNIGDRIHNMTDGKTWTVEAFATATTTSDSLDPVNSPDNTSWANGEKYVVELSELLWTSQSSNANFWTRAGRPKFPYLDATTAALYRDQYATKYNVPVLQQAFVLTAPRIRDGNGALWPLWRPLFGDGYYMRVNDLFPEAALFSSSSDEEKSFLAVAMDYEYTSNRLRIVPSTNDSRLDVIIAQALGEDRRIREIVSAA